MFRNGTLHVTGPYSLDAADFVLRVFVETLNRWGNYTLLPGKILLASYRTTLGMRVSVPHLARCILDKGQIPWQESSAAAISMKLQVEQGTWASVRIFATGSVTISVPYCGSERAQVGGFVRSVVFLRDLLGIE